MGLHVRYHNWVHSSYSIGAFPLLILDIATSIRILGLSEFSLKCPHPIMNYSQSTLIPFLIICSLLCWVQWALTTLKHVYSMGKRSIYCSKLFSYLIWKITKLWTYKITDSYCLDYEVDRWNKANEWFELNRQTFLCEKFSLLNRQMLYFYMCCPYLFHRAKTSGVDNV